MDFQAAIWAVFVGSLFIQLVFWLSFLRLLFFKPRANSDQPVPITIIVCAWNERKNLDELVPLILKQDHPSYELIVVDDRSVDDTYDFLLGLRNEHPQLKIVRVDTVPDHMNAKKYALTLGIKAAQNELILLTDADCRPRSESWARIMSLHFAPEKTFVLGFSPYGFKWSILNLLIQYETLLTGIHYLSAALWKIPYMGVGRNLAYRKSFFLDQNGFTGFQHTLGGDDDLFVNRHSNGTNTQICVSPLAVVESIAKESWGSYLVQKKRHFAVGRHYRRRDKIRLSLFSISQILFWICFVTLAVLTLNPYLTIGGLGLRLILQMIVLGSGAKKLSSKFPIFLIPFMDLIFSVFLPLVSIPALLSKKVKWR